MSFRNKDTVGPAWLWRSEQGPWAPGPVQQDVFPPTVRGALRKPHKQRFSTGVMLLPGDIWQSLDPCFIVTTPARGGVRGISWVGARIPLKTSDTAQGSPAAQHCRPPRSAVLRTRSPDAGRNRVRGSPHSLSSGRPKLSFLD